MSLNVTFNGSVYIIPETGEVGWGGNTTSYLVAIAAGALQKTGGSFTLSAETDFGASFGLKSLSYKSRSTNIAASGIIRLNNNSDAISWRNFANSGDLPLIVDASNRLSYNGNLVLTGTGPTDYVSSITGTANQVIASAAIGAITLSLPQSIATTSTLQFGLLGLGAAVDAKAVLSIDSTTKGFLPPRLTTAQQNAIVSPTTGLLVYNTSLNQITVYDGTTWQPLAISGGGTILSGLQYQLGYYAANGTTISPLPLITANRALRSDTNGLIIASITTDTELSYVNGVTSAIQTQLTGKASTDLSNLASVTINTTLVSDTNNTDDLGTIGIAWATLYLGTSIKSGATILATTTELGYLTGVTSAIQTQLNTKATDSLVVHLAGTETITGLKTFSTKVEITDTANENALTITNTNATAGATVALIGNTITGDTASAVLRVLTVAGPLRNTTLESLGVENLKISTTAANLQTVTINSFNGTTKRAILINSVGSTAIHGTETNDSAAAGDYGEEIQSAVSAVASPTSGNFGDLTSISLTAGDWDVSGVSYTAIGAGAWEAIQLGISTTSGNSTTGLVIGDNRVIASWVSSATTPTQYSLAIPQYRVSLASTTTVYLKFSSTYTANPSWSGRISARRRR